MKINEREARICPYFIKEFKSGSTTTSAAAFLILKFDLGGVENERNQQKRFHKLFDNFEFPANRSIDPSAPPRPWSARRPAGPPVFRPGQILLSKFDRVRVLLIKIKSGTNENCPSPLLAIAQPRRRPLNFIPTNFLSTLKNPSSVTFVSSRWLEPMS